MIFRMLSILFTTATLTVLPSFATAAITRYQCAGLFFPETQVNKGEKNYASGVLTINDQTKTLGLEVQFYSKKKKPLNVAGQITINNQVNEFSLFIAETSITQPFGTDTYKNFFTFYGRSLDWVQIKFSHDNKMYNPKVESSFSSEIVDIAEFSCTK